MLMDSINPCFSSLIGFVATQVLTSWFDSFILGCVFFFKHLREGVGGGGAVGGEKDK